MTDLGGIDQKLDRAREHLNSLNVEERTWIDAQSEYITVKPEPDPTPPNDLVNFSLWVDAVVPISKRIPTIVGDCIQNLRAALDQLAHQLVLAEGGTPTRQTAFPLFEDRLTEKKGTVREIAIEGGIDSTALAFIEAAQPYNRVEDPTEDPLWVLHELSNIDKHRLLILVAEGSAEHKIWLGVGSGGGRGFTATGNIAVRPLEAGTKVGGAGTTAESFQAYPYVKGEIAPRIAFGQSEVCAMQPVADVLQEVSKAVRGVIDQLRLFTFPRAFRVPFNPSDPMSPEVIARARALTEARGDTWPWTEGPLAVDADHEWLVSQRLPPEFFRQ